MMALAGAVDSRIDKTVATHGVWWGIRDVIDKDATPDPDFRLSPAFLKYADDDSK